MTENDMNFDAIFFIGPQGSGKGTQAKLLAEKTGFFYWEMGQILRDIGKSGTELGKKITDLIDQGLLVGNDLLLDVISHQLSQLPPNKPVIFDGVPRKLSQAEFLLKHLAEMGYKKFLTIFIDLPKQESLHRLLLRAKTEGRKDDTQEAIELRLQQYEDDTIPVIDYLKQRSTFVKIDGKPPVEEVTKQINEALASVQTSDHA